jgi:L-alanine-DL-glutamate epimerase-like enolase superfamily enzyme
MKITDLRTILLSRIHEPERQWFSSTFRAIKADAAVVLIDTDEGLTGISEACAYGGPIQITSWVDWYKPDLMGRNPADPALPPHPNGRSSAHDAAVAGIDCALWDLRGQIAGKPTAQLLNASAQTKVRLYASAGCQYDWRKRPEQLIDEALSFIEQGFTAYKFRIGTHWAWDGVTVDRFLSLVRELTQAVDGRMELMAEGNQRLTEDQALQIGKEIDRLGFKWFEEPIPMADIDGYAHLNAALDLPISGGEQLTTLEQFRPYLEKHAYGIVQPDAGWCGISEAYRIAEAAYRYGVDLCPHSWHNGLMGMENAHLVAALPNPRVLEICMHQGPLQWGMIAHPPMMKDGWLVLPERPGLGVELAQDAEQRFPYIEGHYAINVER